MTDTGSKFGSSKWFPDGCHGYSLAICDCENGPYLGARKMGSPCTCERCGYITQEQLDFILAAALAPSDAERGSE